MGELASRIRAKYPGAYDSLPDSDLESKVIVKYPGVYDHLAGGNAAPMPQNDATWAKNRDNFINDTGTLKTKVKEKALNVVRNVVPTRQTLAAVARPVLQAGGAVGGGLLGSAAGPVGTVGGAGLGYAIGDNLADFVEGDYYSSPKEAATRTLSNVGTGAMLEMGGQSVVPALKMAAKGVGAVVKPTLGRLSGVGPGAIDEAIKSGKDAAPSLNPFKSKTAYDQALRGKVSGEEIVNTARDALNTLKTNRATAYQAKMTQIEQNQTPLDLASVRSDLMNLMGKYKVTVDPATGAIDTSRVPMGAKGRNDIKQIIEDVTGWGSKQGDDTAVGLDTLKRQLDDFYSDSSQARQFVTEIRNKVKGAITSRVPEYDEMTKGYAEATKLIKDVETDLMLRKNGMSGRVTADKTLRRLTSAMRDNFEMRRELVEILGAKTGDDLAGQVAGYTMNTALPRGLAGTGPLLAGQAAYAQFVNPKFWPVLAASSPRVQGEFLRMFGKAMGTAQKIGPQGARAATIGAVVAGQNTTER